MWATEQRKRSLGPFWALQPVQLLHTRWSAASKIVQREKRTSARSWMQRTSSRVLPVISLKPHPSPSNPCKINDPPSRRHLRLQSQYTATSMLDRTIRLHRRSHVVSTHPDRSKHLLLTTPPHKFRQTRRQYRWRSSMRRLIPLHHLKRDRGTLPCEQ